jgi:catechol 2,3-dioxygenase-like lactoylglutathione lyase family enzyme
MKKSPMIPRLDGGQQVILLVADVVKSIAFYRDNLRLMVRDGDGDRYGEVDSGGGGMLVLIKSAGSLAPMASRAAASTPETLSFSIEADGYEIWKKWLVRRGVAIEAERRWIHGGRSLYVRDPDGRRLEFYTPAIMAPPPKTVPRARSTDEGS